MGQIFLTSDLHLGHDKNFIWKARGFNSIEEHDEAIIERWNKTVSKEDEVYILGDLALGSLDNARDRLAQLNGNICWVKGNHDTPTRERMYLFDLGFGGCGAAAQIKHGNGDSIYATSPLLLIILKSVANFSACTDILIQLIVLNISQTVAIISAWMRITALLLV